MSRLSNCSRENMVQEVFTIFQDYQTEFNDNFDFIGRFWGSLICFIVKIWFVLEQELILNGWRISVYIVLIRKPFTYRLEG